VGDALAVREGSRVSEVVAEPYPRDREPVDPPYLYPDYVGTRLRAPKQPLVPLPHSLTELTGPLLGEGRVGPSDHDLTSQHEGEPQGQRIIVHGRVLDVDGRYRFITIRPGAYPWPNHENAWRAAHIHFSLFGNAFPQRLVTQMYFPGDPLFWQDPIFNAIPDPRGRERLISRFDLNETVPEWALGFEWDIVLRGRDATPVEDEEDDG
jgi:protocatechuate 3,4-dioxygenase beta subunit